MLGFIIDADLMLRSAEKCQENQSPHQTPTTAQQLNVSNAMPISS